MLGLKVVYICQYIGVLLVLCLAKVMRFCQGHTGGHQVWRVGSRTATTRQKKGTS